MHVRHCGVRTLYPAPPPVPRAVGAGVGVGAGAGLKQLTIRHVRP